LRFIFILETLRVSIPAFNMKMETDLSPEKVYYIQAMDSVQRKSSHEPDYASYTHTHTHTDTQGGAQKFPEFEYPSQTRRSSGFCH
jgi:hypothetical protein